MVVLDNDYYQWVAVLEARMAILRAALPITNQTAIIRQAQALELIALELECFRVLGEASLMKFAHRIA